VSSGSSGATTSATVSIPVPTGLQPGDVVLLTIFTSASNVYDLLVNANVDWAHIALRGNSNGAQMVQMQGYARRVPVGGETVTSYTFILNELQIWMGTAVRVGDPYLMGITDISSKGQDNAPILYTIVTQTPINVDVPNSTVVSFYGAQVPVSGTGSWSPLGGDTEVFDSRTTRTGTSSNITVAVNVASNVAQGTYLKQATLSPAASVSAIVGLVVVLAPKLAGDEAQHAAWTFSELNPNSPYGGKTRTRRETQWKVGMYTEAGLEEVQIFTGLSILTSASARNKTASIIANDNREWMRNQWFAPSNWVAESPVSLDSEFPMMTLPGLETTAIISYLLAWSQFRRIDGVSLVTRPRDMGPYSGFGFFASPPMRPNSCLLWAPIHGTMHPFQGDIQGAWTRLPGGQYRRVKFAAGPYVAATEQSPRGGLGSIYGKWLCRTDFANVWHDPTSQLHGRLEFWARTVASTGVGDVLVTVTDDTVLLTKMIRAIVTPGGTFSVRIKMIGGIDQTIVGPTAPNDEEWHFYGVHVHSSLSSVIFRVDGVTTNAALTPWANAAIPGSTPAYGLLSLFNSAQAAEVQIHGGVNGSTDPGNTNMIALTTPWLNENFVPSAYIDKSINEIDAIPPGIDNASDMWEILSAIANAEFSALYFDGDGVAHYRNTRSDVSTTGQVVQRVLTARSTLKDLEYENGVRQVANFVSFGYTPMAPFINAQVFNPGGGALLVPAGSQLTFTFQIPGTIVGGLIGFASFTRNGNTLPNGLGTAVVNIPSTVFLDANNFVGVLQISNPNAFDVYMVDGSGQSNMIIIGTFVGPSQDQVQPVTQTNIPSIRIYDVQPLQVSSSPWIQHEDVATSYAMFLVSELGDPRPVIKKMPIKGDPRLQLGDLHGVQDVNGLGVNGNYRLTGISHNADNNGTYNQDVTVRQSSTVAHWNVNYWNDGTVWGV